MAKKKAEFGTPKWYSKQNKMRGLQKVKFWCQVCEKQCRDDNSYKQHGLSMSHRRNMEKFISNQGEQTSRYSSDFEGVFMRIIRSQFRNTKIPANHVYQLVIQDKSHVHLNSTRWTSLNEFCYYLQRTERVEVEMAERGPILTFIDLDARARVSALELKADKDAAMERADAASLARHAETHRREIQRNIRYRDRVDDTFTNRKEKNGGFDIGFKFKQATTPVQNSGFAQIDETRDEAGRLASAKDCEPKTRSIFGASESEEEEVPPPSQKKRGTSLIDIAKDVDRGFRGR